MLCAAQDVVITTSHNQSTQCVLCVCVCVHSCCHDYRENTKEADQRWLRINFLGRTRWGQVQYEGTNKFCC